MALRIKLTRIGRKNNPKYRIVVAEAKSKRDGKYVEQIGFYDPILQQNSITLDKEKLTGWMQKGASFTKGTERLLRNFSK
ncbi:30S ribosomal protein S16 [Candidatus Roizmanbacteria bacterium RIFCSPHIGHO2_02_FULL_40_9]|uniref:Small ribosomal subunit protein bS16 n=2 Tax=Candidatus Roizmaniibacteriota TaxID=1752723 RepID=A0A1F7IP24_9BACT|nr:MAG: 30S ribosomal protein S16 [Candidatus Roizmanbacteria bacterium RIFCSPHIGHO2_02_FULL_40_9]OGK45081.1 MAG: 30S ribosomal protein S16 [Candidatus Roizmanbacteria bacterium RIFCSPLOWO2_01_FULL_38_11]